LLHPALRLGIEATDQGNASPQNLGIPTLRLLFKVFQFDAQPITGALCPYECWIAQSRLFAPLRAAAAALSAARAFEHYQTRVASRRGDLSNNSWRPSFCE
jgi:hypothetical protein